jgi:WD40 repeat protein
LTLVKDDQYLVTGCGDAELRVWKLSYKDPDLENKSSVDHLTTTLELIDLHDTDDPNVSYYNKLITFKMYRFFYSSASSAMPQSGIFVASR